MGECVGVHMPLSHCARLVNTHQCNLALGPGQEIKGADERQLAQEAGDVRVAAVADGAHGGRPGSETPTRGPAWAVPTQKAKHSSRRMVGAKGVRCPNLRPKAATLPTPLPLGNGHLLG